MRNTRHLMVAAFWLGAGSLTLSGTTNRAAGLWEITTTMTWEETPKVSGADRDKLPSGTHTKQVCLTQEMIDDYGALLPQARGSCTIENRAMTGGKMTGDYICNGMMAGKGVLESTWTDAQHATGKVHFVGTFLVGTERQPIEWTTEMASTFKSSSCGMIKPQPLTKR